MALVLLGHQSGKSIHPARIMLIRQQSLHRSMLPVTFLSLPRELRDQIFFLAVKSSLVREWLVAHAGLLLLGRREKLTKSSLIWEAWEDKTLSDVRVVKSGN